MQRAEVIEHRWTPWGHERMNQRNTSTGPASKRAWGFGWSRTVRRDQALEQDKQAVQMRTRAVPDDAAPTDSDDDVPHPFAR